MGIPKVENKTGKVCAEKVFEHLKAWKISNRIRGMVFDTTATNTGVRLGACIILEQLLNRELLHFACRHHVLELLISNAYTVLVEKTSAAPEILLFKRFAKYWNNIDSSRFSAETEDKLSKFISPNTKHDLIKFINEEIIVGQKRADYLEFLELSLLFLNERETSTGKKILIRKPGAISRARFMAKLIYGIKIYLFRGQFHLTGNILHLISSNTIQKPQFYGEKLLNS